MTAVLRALRRHRGRRLKSRIFAGIPGYVLVSHEDPGARVLLAWFPARAVDPLVGLGMVSADGSLTRCGLAKIEGDAE